MVHAAESDIEQSPTPVSRFGFPRACCRGPCTLRFQAFHKLQRQLDPTLQVSIGCDSFGNDDHPAFHGPTGQVHRADVRLSQSRVTHVRTEPRDEAVNPDGDQHVPVQQEADAAEHLLLRHARLTFQDSADAFRQKSAIGHQAVLKNGATKTLHDIKVPSFGVSSAAAARYDSGMTEVDYIIVGQGLAGTCLAWELLAHGASVRVIDREAAVTSSRIAAGLITPVTGQRLVKSWRFEELRAAAWTFYRRIESELMCSLLRDTSMVKVFNTETEQEYFEKRMSDPAYAGLFRVVTEFPAGVQAPLGGCELLRGGQLDVGEFLSQSRRVWIREGQYLTRELSLPDDVRLVREGEAPAEPDCRDARGNSSGPLSPAIEADDTLDSIAGERARVRGPHESPRPLTPALSPTVTSSQKATPIVGERGQIPEALGTAASCSLHRLRSPDRVELPRWNLRARTLVFCEGVAARTNPWFSNVEFKPARGEMLLVEIPLWTEQRIIHGGVWIAPIRSPTEGQARRSRVGATYDWDQLDAGPTAEGRSSLTESLEKLLLRPYRIVEHQAAVRPILKHVTPVIGLHPRHPQLGYFNGLGSKGSLQAPFLAKQLASHLVQQTPLEREVDLQVRVPWPHPAS